VKGEGPQISLTKDGLGAANVRTTSQEVSHQNGKEIMDDFESSLALRKISWTRLRNDGHSPPFLNLEFCKAILNERNRKT